MTLDAIRRGADRRAAGADERDGAERLASDDEASNPTRPGRFTALTRRFKEALP